jgi:hypothetical protein
LLAVHGDGFVGWRRRLALQRGFAIGLRRNVDAAFGGLAPITFDSVSTTAMLASTRTSDWVISVTTLVAPAWVVDIFA